MKQLDPDTGDLFLRFYGFSYLKFLAIVVSTTYWVAVQRCSHGG